ncbi:hypothetical protein RCL1_001548 [Eukaryota sp. TZLM3-RCL]
MDPLAPFLFCLALNRVNTEVASEHPSLKIVNHADDTSFIGPTDQLRCLSDFYEHLSSSIGLQLNSSEFVLFGRQFENLLLNSDQVAFVDYNSSATNFWVHFLVTVQFAALNLTDEVAKSFSEIRSNFERRSNSNSCRQYTSPYLHVGKYGGLSRASVSRKAAFLGGVKNFVFELSHRYPDFEGFLLTADCDWLVSARDLIYQMDNDIWAACFSSK